MAKKIPVALCYVTHGLVRAEFMNSCMAVSQRYKLASRVWTNGGALVAAARNKVVRGFLETKADYLWFLDTDMVFEPYVIEDLLEADKDIVSGLCYGLHEESQRPFPACFTWDGDKLVNGYPAPKEDPLVEVAGAGAACILIRREVLEAMEKKFDPPWNWYRETLMGERPVGEDVNFCLRAAECGYSTWLHTGIRIQHVKTRLI